MSIIQGRPVTYNILSFNLDAKQVVLAPLVSVMEEEVMSKSTDPVSMGGEEVTKDYNVTGAVADPLTQLWAVPLEFLAKVLRQIGAIFWPEYEKNTGAAGFIRGLWLCLRQLRKIIPALDKEWMDEVIEILKETAAAHGAPGNVPGGLGGGVAGGEGPPISLP